MNTTPGSEQTQTQEQTQQTETQTQETGTQEQTQAQTQSTEAWTPYVPDPAKSAQENLLAKEEYDKSAPEGQDPNVPGKPAEKQEEKKTEEQVPALTLDQIKAPEGFEIDPALGKEFTDLLNTEKDPVKLAQGLIELSAKANQVASEKGSEAFDAVQTEWQEASKKDPEIGGEKYEGNLATSEELVNRFGGPKLKEALELTGMGNHPEFLRFITKVAPFVKEAPPVPPGTQTKTPGYSSTNLYPANP